ncbi:hypothetical protein LLG96_17450 [bacterium]|nr:hypothetical protein [bacterium]
MKTLTITAFISILSVHILYGADAPKNTTMWSQRIQTVLDSTQPLRYERGKRLPLYLWPAMDPGKIDEKTAEQLVRELDRRGIGLICSWSPENREESLSRGLVVARAQKKLGVPVNINANQCLYRFFNGDECTAHIDDKGKPFWDDSFGNYKMGCPFTLDNRKDAIREQVEFFVKAYKDSGLTVDFIFADWEIDGPLEFNRAYEASKRCARCRENIKNIDSFPEFQKALRVIRSDLQRYAFTEPVLSRFPDALVGNYAVYPHDGYRYWYDYYEYYVDGQPYKEDRRAKYRAWYDDFPGTGYTFAMPVVYSWARLFGWYDFDNPDYRWFYNMLLVAGNAGKHTPSRIPVISFVHWNMINPEQYPAPGLTQFSAEKYQELLWHMLLRGTDTFFMWCGAQEEAEEIRLVHEVYAAAQEYGEFLEHGTPITFDVPPQPGTVVSGLVLGNRVLVRRTDFAGSDKPVEIRAGNRTFTVKPAPGKCQVFELR